MRFKTPEIKAQFDNPKLDFRVKFIIYAIDSYMLNNFYYDITITEIWREHLHDGDIHSEFRAIDLRISDMSRFNLDNLLWFIDHLIYTGEKNTRMVHNVDVSLPPDHIHIQVDGDGLTSISKEVVENEKTN